MADYVKIELQDGGSMAIHQKFVVYLTRVAVFSVFDYIGAGDKGIAFKTSNIAWTVANELSKSPDVHFGHHCVRNGNSAAVCGVFYQGCGN